MSPLHVVVRAAAALGLLLTFTSSGFAQDEFLRQLYDRLHDSPTQRRFQQIRPMPFGVVFLPWKGMTQQQMRGHFRLMKQLGFHNLKQTMPTPEWPERRIFEIAFEEGIIPFWYGEGGWAPITPELLRDLGIAADTPMPDIRRHPKMRAYQTEILKKGIEVGNSGFLHGRAAKGPEDFRHTPDPYLRPADARHFKQWLRSAYASPEAVNTGWNLGEVGITPDPFQSWADVDAEVDRMAATAETSGAYGREYGRIRDVLRYKADFHTAEIAEAIRQRPIGNPWAPTRTGGEMGLFLPFAWRATKMEDLAQTQLDVGSFYPSIHFAWHYGEVDYEVARPIYMQASFAHDLFKGGWSAPWESTGGPQQLTGSKGWDAREATTTPGFTTNAGTITQLFLSYLAAGFKGAGVWTWNFREAGFEAGEYALLDRNLQPTPRAIRAGKIAQAAEQFRDELWEARKEPQVGVLVNWDNDAIWAAISVRQRDHYRHYPMRARVGVSRALMNANVPWEFVTVDDLRAGLAPRYKVIYLAGQIAFSDELLQLLLDFAKQGGRVVLDAPGGAYTETGKVRKTLPGTLFHQLFGAELADLQYSNNVPRVLRGKRLNGFIETIKPTTAKPTEWFQTGEPAIVENHVGKGSAVMLGWDASFALFHPGEASLESWLVQAAMGGLQSPYACDGAVVYRIAHPNADHYFFINDAEARQVHLDTRGKFYRRAVDPVSGEELAVGGAIALEAYSGRWLRMEK
jgi:beta-galactosidase